MDIKVLCYFPYGELRYATRNISDNEGNWQNGIISISSLSRNIGEDKAYEISGLSVEFNDSDRFFRTMMSGSYRYIAGKTVQVLDKNGNIIYTGKVEKWEFREDSFTIFINDRLSGLDSVIPTTVSKEEFPGIEDEGEGTSIPIIYGHVRTVGGAVKCWRVQSGKYLLASHHCNNLESAYDKEGNDISNDCSLLLEGSQGQDDERSYITYTGLNDLEYIRVNVKGKMSSGILIEDPLTVLQDVISEYTDMTLNTMNLEENRIVMQDRGYIYAGVIQDQFTVKDFLAAYALSFDCDFFMDKGNEIVITLLNWDELKAVKALNRNQITSFQLQEHPDEIRNKVKYSYRFNVSAAKYQREPEYEKLESIGNWGEFYNRNERLELRYVYDDVAALDVVQRFTFQRMNPRRTASVEIPLLEYSGLDIGDVVEISHPGAIDENERKYQVRRVDVDFISDIVQMECVDITSLSAGIFILGDENIAEYWEEASDFERQFAYLCDSDGFFANGLDEGKILY